jgi:hypothetical protein
LDGNAGNETALPDAFSGYKYEIANPVFMTGFRDAGKLYAIAAIV